MAKKSRAKRDDVVTVFRKLNLPLTDDAPAHFGQSYDPTVIPVTPGVQYRTILTNGTGQVLRSGYAELE
jgi:hypothetical protein